MYEIENMSFEEIEAKGRLEQLAVEIVTFDRQAKITAVSCAIEIGERLLEAKEPCSTWRVGKLAEGECELQPVHCKQLHAALQGVRERPGEPVYHADKFTDDYESGCFQSPCTYRASTRGARGVCIRARCREYVHPGPERSLAGKQGVKAAATAAETSAGRKGTASRRKCLPA